MDSIDGKDKSGWAGAAYRRGVRVNIVGPGPIETGMFNCFAQTAENKAAFLDAQVPNKRIGPPEELADAIVYIGSDKASYIIGASLAVDGHDRRLTPVASAVGW